MFRVRFLTTTVFISGLGDLDRFGGDFAGDFDDRRGDLDPLRGDFEPFRGDFEAFRSGDFLSLLSIFFSRFGDFDLEADLDEDRLLPLFGDFERAI